MQKTFSGGVHPDSNKALSALMNIEVMPIPPVLSIPLLQHSGRPALPVVKNGDEVIKGQMIGKGEGRGACNVFSSCCGKVKAIEERVTPKGSCQHIIIESNGKKDNAHLQPLHDPSKEEIVQRVFDCGVSGMGGAGYPAAAKLNPGAEIEYLLINGAECEPYITCDYRIMKEYTEKFLGGVMLMQKALDAKKTIIGIESNKADAIEALNNFIAHSDLPIKVVALKPKYPQGSDRQLIDALTGKKVAKGARSSSFGISVSNVHTALSVYLAVKEGTQSYSRIVTVTGGSIKNPKNLWVPTGASFADVIEFCGGIVEENPPIKIISGGPMMGTTIYDTAVSISKITGCILLMGKGELEDYKESPCINCGKCARVCPMKLMPMNIDEYSRAGRYEDAEKWGLKYCIECGSCAFICPAKRHLVQSIVLAKSRLKGGKE